MMRIKSYLAASPLHGVGCFAAENVSAGTLVWQFDPKLDRELLPNEIGAVPETATAFLKSHAWKSPSGTILVCLDSGGYFNHSNTPNTCMSEDGYQCLAIKDIVTGEELTTNYIELPNIPSK